ncbi:protein HEADING DATE REPRESSOR 1 [Sorghum bicolor]|nr:protein HEADING DATE REPRESSOR 1 [Sorghum bicolor]|eukprot:XP_002454692.1 protein HEADING DATE REPRESSOR 1 [Sorghum bicolor]
MTTTTGPRNGECIPRRPPPPSRTPNSTRPSVSPEPQDNATNKTQRASERGEGSSARGAARQPGPGEREAQLAWSREAAEGAREQPGMEEPVPADPPRIFWKSRRSANGRSLQQEPDKDATEETNEQAQEEPMKTDDATDTTATAEDVQPDPKANLSEKRKALFEPLEPINGKRSAEMLLPPPDFEPASYPKGWLVGKKRKLVNVDVVESMRRIAIQEMNRKDREINGLNEQLEEDSRVLELLQKQLADERKKRAEIEKENSMLHEQVNMLMNMLDENEGFDEDGEAPPPDSFD